jgi:hypothetical protein
MMLSACFVRQSGAIIIYSIFPAQYRGDPMKQTTASLNIAGILVISLLLVSCATGIQLRTITADPTEVKGTYTLLLYGCHYPAQIQDVAILVDETSRHPVEIFDLATSYTVKKGVPAGQALVEADRFVRCSANRIWRTELRKILDEAGGTIGYEIRPLYLPLQFAPAGVIEVSYALHKDTVRAYIRLNPDVEKQMDQGPSDGRDSSSGM